MRNRTNLIKAILIRMRLFPAGFTATELIHLIFPEFPQVRSHGAKRHPGQALTGSRDALMAFVREGFALELIHIMKRPRKDQLVLEKNEGLPYARRHLASYRKNTFFLAWEIQIWAW